MATSINQFNDDKDVLLLRIKDLEFVDDASEFKCKRCGNVLINHYISNCGHAFCSNCKRRLGDGSGRWKCPECQEFITEIDRQDFEIERKLFDLNVRCANHKYGCSLTCLLKELGEHLKTCEFTRENALPVLCNATNSIEAVFEQLSTINRKLDKINADIGLMEGKIIKVEVNQVEFDNKLKTLDERIDTVNLIPFPQQQSPSKSNQVPIEWTSTIDAMKSNVSNLSEKSELRWKYMELKDEKINKALEQMKQNFEDDIENLRFQFQDAMNGKVDAKDHDAAANVTRHSVGNNNLKNLEEKIEKNKKELISLKRLSVTNNNVEAQLQNMESTIKPQILRLENFINMIKLQVQPVMLKEIYSTRQADYVLKISDAPNHLKLDEFEIKGEKFGLHEYPLLEARAKLKSEGKELFVSVSLKDKNSGNEVAAASNLLPSPSLFLILRNQVEGRDWDFIRSANKKFRSPANSKYYFGGIDKSMLFGLFNNYMKNNRLMLEIHVEPPALTRHVFSYDGTLRWAIESYKKWKQLAYYDYVKWHESPYFYTSLKGYRVQMRMVLNYVNEDVTAYVNFLNGEFDEQLNGAFPYKITVSIINQKNPNGHIIKSIVFNDAETLTFSQNYENNKIYMGGFKEIDKVVKNDTLHYHVKIEAM